MDSSEDMTETKRQRQREHAKRSYYKRVKAMSALKLERDVLEKQYREALAAQKNAGGPGSPADFEQLQLSPVREIQANVPDVDRILELSKARDELREQNKQLKRAIGRFFTLQRRLQQSMEDLDNESELAGNPELAASLANGDDVAVSRVLAQQFNRVILTKPLTSEECAEMTRKTHDEMVAFLKGTGGYLGSAGTSLCGWQEYRTTRNGRFRFSTRKHFPRRSALELSSKTWEIVSSATNFQELYSTSISMQLDTVQRVDDDNVLFYRTVQIPNSTKVSKSLMLCSHFHCSSGHVVLLQSLERSRIVATPYDEFDDSFWTDVFLWVVFSEEGPNNENCMMEFGGFLMNATTEMGEFWMLEALLISLRWENRVVGPVFKAL